MKIVLYVAFGVVWLLVGLWYVRSVYSTFFDKGLPNVIAPFQFVGKDDKDEVRGHALAQMLVARLDSLQQEIDDAESALRVPSGTAPQAQPALQAPALRPVDPAKPIHLDTRVLEIPKLQLSVSGVELSGVLNWIYRSVAEGRAIRIVVYVPGDGQKATLSANLETLGATNLWLPDLEPGDRVWIEQVALEILRRHAARTSRLREAAGLDRTEFAKLIVALRTIALLNQKVQAGVQPSTAEYTQVVNDLDPLLARTPKWRLLIEVAAKAAENSRDLAKARQLYQRELDLVQAVEPAGRPLTGEEQQEFDRLTAIVRKLEAALHPAASVALVPPLTGPALLDTWPGNLMAVPAGPPKGGHPRVAILGGTPLSGQVLALDTAEILDLQETASVSQSDTLREHVGHVAETIRSIAPNARFVYTRTSSAEGGVSVEGDLLVALDQLVQAKPDVIVIPLGSADGLRSAAWQAALGKAGRAATVVVAAGNEGEKTPAALAGTALAGEVIVAAAVDKGGKAAPFTSFSKTCFWAPGVDIPVRSAGKTAAQSGQRIFSGTSFAAALTAGAVARLKGEKPSLTTAEIIGILRETSKEVAPGGPKVIQLAAALQKIGA
jgi:hypothetical protein